MPAFCDRDHRDQSFSATLFGSRSYAPQQHGPTTRAEPLDKSRNAVATAGGLGNTSFRVGVRGRTMSKQDAGYDYTRYRKLLAEAVDETKRLELIDLMIREKARDRLAEQRMSDRVAMTTATVSRILGPGSRPHDF